MPSLEFTLPHWAYYLGLTLFPLIAWFMARRQNEERDRYSLPIAFMIWLTGGIMGIHRYYARSWLGVIFTILFLSILFFNAKEAEWRNYLSDATNNVRVSEKVIERESRRLMEGERDLPELRAALAEAEIGSFSERSAQRRLQRTQDAVDKARLSLAKNHAIIEEFTPIRDTAQAEMNKWNGFAKYGFWVILLGLAIDLLLLPKLVARANRLLEIEKANDGPHMVALDNDGFDIEEEEIKEDHEHISKGWTGWIDRLSSACGEFVSYWAVLAVIVYFFEVVARYAFNSPTSWAHESMYLMFGMQYLIAGSYALMCEAHVRVDIFYSNFSPRRKAIVDILTSIFFFIFAITLMVTSYIFAFDSITVPSGNALISQLARGEIDFMTFISNVSLSMWSDPNIRWGEISFNEWEIPLWPMKWVMVLGGFLLVLQGISKLAQNICVVIKGV